MEPEEDELELFDELELLEELELLDELELLEELEVVVPEQLPTRLHEASPPGTVFVYQLA